MEMFEKMEDITEKHKNKFKLYHLIYYVSYILIFLLIVIGFNKRTIVNRFSEYNSKNEVALYLYKYDKLPSNFITKSEWDGDYNMLVNGSNVGGDQFLYKGSIVNHTKHNILYECDIYLSRKNVGSLHNRGVCRIVFSIVDEEVKEVFYTNDHYETFTYIEKDSINKVSNGIFIFTGVLMLIAFVAIFEECLRRKTRQYLYDLGETLLCVLCSPIFLTCMIVYKIKNVHI